MTQRGHVAKPMAAVLYDSATRLSVDRLASVTEPKRSAFCEVRGFTPQAVTCSQGRRTEWYSREDDPTLVRGSEKLSCHRCENAGFSY